MPRYLLDTNAIGDLVRNPHGPVRQMIERRGEARICTSIVAAAELRYGAAKKASPRIAALVAGALDRLTVEPFAAPADRHYGELRADLERRGLPVSANDMLIAAHALALGCVLVTDNEREFSRVKSLRWENWL